MIFVIHAVRLLGFSLLLSYAAIHLVTILLAVICCLFWQYCSKFIGLGLHLFWTCKWEFLRHIL